MAEAGRGQPFLDAQLGFVVGHRDAIDPDDRDVDDVGDAGPARSGDEVVRRHHVFSAGALGCAVHNHIHTLEGGIDAGCCE